MREVIAVLGGRFQDKSEAGIEILGSISALIGNMRWVVDDYVKCSVSLVCLANGFG
jgi:hypothetical protein